MKHFFKILFILLISKSVLAQSYVVPPRLNFAACGSYPTAYQTLGAITITETVTNGFASFAGTATITINAPTGYSFNAGIGAATNSSGGGDNVNVTGITVTASVITITYTCGGTNQGDNINITGIQIQATSNSGSANLTLTSNTQTINGTPVGTTLANLFLYNSAPSNDAICSATPLTLGTCLSNQTNYCATSDINTGCVAAGGRTVWYSATLTGANTVLSIDFSGTTTIQGLQLYSGACGAPAAVSSDCAAPYSFTGLTAGTPYLIGVNVATANAGVFSICPSQAQALAGADLCASAVAIPTNGTSVVGTTVGMAQEINIGLCAETRDVWYKFTTSATPGCYSFNLQGSNIASTDNAITILQNNCAVPSAVTGGLVCSANYYADLASTEFTAGWAASTTYLILVSTSTAQQFTLTVNDNSSLQANDQCSGAQAIQPTPVITDNATNSCNYSYVAAQDGNVAPAELCALSLENVSWYVLQASGSGVVQTTFSSILCNNGGGGFQMGYFSGTCGALSNINCLTAASGSTTITLYGVTAGQNIYFAMDGDAGSNCHWTLSGTNVSVLPINLAEFEVISMEGKAKLNWFTVSEFNNNRFEIERSKDGEIFDVIGSVKGQGTTKLPFNYNYTDANLQNGYYYYRLKQIDNNDRFTYSEIKSVFVSNDFKTPLIVYPNPAQNEISLSFEEEIEMEDFEVKIINAIAGEVFNPKININSPFRLDISDLKPGIYFVQVSNKGAHFMAKFVKN